MRSGLKPQPLSGSNCDFLDILGRGSGSIRKQSGSASGSFGISHEISYEISHEISSEISPGLFSSSWSSFVVQQPYGGTWRYIYKGFAANACFSAPAKISR